MIEIPIRLRRVRGGSCKARFSLGGYRFRRQERRQAWPVFHNGGRITCRSADIALVLASPHNEAQGKEDARKYQHQQEETDDVPALQSPLTFSTAASHPLFRRPQRTSPRIDDIHWEGKYNGCVLLDTNLGQRLQVAKLDGGRFSCQHLGGIGQFLRGFELAYCVNDLGAAFTRRVGLLV